MIEFNKSEHTLEIDDETLELAKRHFHTQNPEPFLQDVLCVEVYAWTCPNIDTELKAAKA